MKKRLKAIASAWKKELPAIWVAALLFMVPPLCVLAEGGYSGYSQLKVNEFSLAQWQREGALEEVVVYLATKSNAGQDAEEREDIWNEDEEYPDAEKASGSDAKKASDSNVAED